MRPHHVKAPSFCSIECGTPHPPTGERTLLRLVGLSKVEFNAYVYVKLYSTGFDVPSEFITREKRGNVGGCRRVRVSRLKRPVQLRVEFRDPSIRVSTTRTSRRASVTPDPASPDPQHRDHRRQ
jgi:hypothetical protein